MEEKYTMVTLASIPDIDKIFRCHRWKKRVPLKLYQYYLLKKLPMKQEEVFYLGEPGLRMILPFTVEDLNQNIDFINQFLHIWKKNVQMEALLLEPALRKKLEPNENQKAWLICYFLFPQIFQLVVNKYGIDCKKMKMVLVDSGDSRTEYLLELLLPYLNYLTILTSRPQYYNEIKDAAMEETGLMVEVLEMPLHEPIKGNFILCAGGQDSWYGIRNRLIQLEHRSILLFLDGDRDSVRCLGQRRKDLIYIYDLVVRMGEEQVDKAFAAAILGEIDWRVKWFLEHRGNYHYAHEAEILIERYKMSLESLCVFEP